MDREGSFAAMFNGARVEPLYESAVEKANIMLVKFDDRVTQKKWFYFLRSINWWGR